MDTELLAEEIAFMNVNFVKHSSHISICDVLAIYRHVTQIWSISYVFYISFFHVSL